MMARRNLSHPSTAVPSDVRPKYEAIRALSLGSTTARNAASRPSKSIRPRGSSCSIEGAAMTWFVLLGRSKVKGLVAATTLREAM
jgi:hypothetical protein